MENEPTRTTEFLVLNDQFLDHVPVYIGQSALDTIVVEAQPFVINAKQVECSGVKIVGVGGVHCRFPAEFIRGAVACAAPNAAACQPRGEGAGIVVATLAFISLSGGLATEFSGTDHEGFIK